MPRTTPRFVFVFCPPLPPPPTPTPLESHEISVRARVRDIFSYLLPGGSERYEHVLLSAVRCVPVSAHGIYNYSGLGTRIVLATLKRKTTTTTTQHTHTHTHTKQVMLRTSRLESSNMFYEISVCAGRHFHRACLCFCPTSMIWFLWTSNGICVCVRGE